MKLVLNKCLFKASIMLFSGVWECNQGNIGTPPIRQIFSA